MDVRHFSSRWRKAQKPKTRLMAADSRSSDMSATNDSGYGDSEITVSDIIIEDRAPTTLEYAMDGGRQTVHVLQMAAGLIPVPYIQDTIRVALKVVEACQEVTVIEQDVEELQDRICRLMIVIVDLVTVQGDSEDSITRAAQAIKTEVKALYRVLKEIANDLKRIKSQKRWVLFVFRDLNKSKVEHSMKRLTSALEGFHLFSALRNADVLNQIEARIEKIHGWSHHVGEHVDNIHDNVSAGFAMIMDNLKHAETHNKSTTPTRPKMPLKPRVFHGRDALVNEISRLLSNEETSRVCILGPGGMGKTSVALAVMEMLSTEKRFSSANRFWVPCIEATSPSLFLQMLSSCLRVTRNTASPLDDILNALNTSKQPRIILLDNFETPWNLTDGMQQEVNDIICHLANLSHVALLVTMRGTYPPSDDIKWQSKNLLPTDQEACLHIFQDINPIAKDDQDLQRLLEALGNMPFAVTLMANLGKETRASSRELLQEWSRAGTGIISSSSTPEKSMNRSISLSVDSNLVKQDPDALILLATLSMLPAGTTRDHLTWWAPSMKSHLTAIATLSKAALLMVNDGDANKSPTLFVLPVIQSYMQSNNRVPDEIQRHVRQACCEYILNHASRSGASKFTKDATALAAEDTNIQSILLNVKASAVEPQAHPNSGQLVDPSKPLQATSTAGNNDLIESLLSFSWYRHDTKPSIEFSKHTLNLARASGQGMYIAEAQHCLGASYGRLASFELSCSNLREAFTRFKGISTDPDTVRRAGQCGLDLADNMGFMKSDTDDIINLVLEVLADFEKSGDEHGRGLGLTMLGEAYWIAQDRELALKTLDDANRILEAMDYQTDTARCLKITSIVLFSMKNYEKALQFIKQALKIAESANAQHVLVDSMQMAGRILLRLDHVSEAMQHFEKSLYAYQNLGAVLGMAQSLEYMGCAYIREGKLQDAYTAYEAALDKYTGMGAMTLGKLGKDQCENNLVRIRQKQEKPEEDVGFLRPTLDRRDTSLIFPRKDPTISSLPLPLPG